MYPDFTSRSTCIIGLAVILLLCTPTLDYSDTSTVIYISEDAIPHSEPAGIEKTRTRAYNTIEGDWLIDEDTLLEGENTLVEGDVIIYGSELRLSNLSLIVSGSILVCQNVSMGRLVVNNATITVEGNITVEGSMDISHSDLEVWGEINAVIGHVNVSSSWLYLFSQPYSIYKSTGATQNNNSGTNLYKTLPGEKSPVPLQSWPSSHLGGTVYYQNGSISAFQKVYVTCDRTMETLEDVADENGVYRVSLGDFPSGLYNGDSFTIRSTYKAVTSENTTTIPNLDNPPIHTMDLQLWGPSAGINIHSNLKMENSTILSGTEYNYHIMWLPTSHGNLYNTTISHCGGPEGGMTIWTADLTIDRVVFSDNTRGIVVEDIAQRVENSTFVNSSSWDAVALEGATITLVNSTVDQNKLLAERNSSVIVAWHFNFIIGSDNGPLEDVEIALRTNMSGDMIFTDSSGASMWNIVVEYEKNNTETLVHGLCNITIFKEDYFTIWAERIVNKSHTMYEILQLIEPLEGTIRLLEGVNYISLPGDAGGWCASMVANSIEENTSYMAYAVSNWGPLGWVTYENRDHDGLISGGGVDFSLETGMGLMIYLREDETQMRDRRWRHGVEPLTLSHPHNMVPGLNLVGIPYHTGATSNASSIREQIDLQGGNDTFLHISEWVEGTWRTHYPGDSVTDFLVVGTDGNQWANHGCWFIGVSSYTTWTPQ